MSDEYDPPTRRRPVQREHIFQRYACEFADSAIDMPNDLYHFFSFDSARKATQNERAREASRGIRRDTLDTLLLVQGLPGIWTELKAGTNTPSAGQAKMILKLERLGGKASVAWSIHDIFVYWRSAGVPMRANAEYISTVLDGKIASGIIKAEARSGRPKKARKSEPRTTAPRSVTKRWTAAGLKF